MSFLLVPLVNSNCNWMFWISHELCDKNTSERSFMSTVWLWTKLIRSYCCKNLIQLLALNEALSVSNVRCCWRAKQAQLDTTGAGQQLNGNRLPDIWTLVTRTENTTMLAWTLFSTLWVGLHMVKILWSVPQSYKRTENILIFPITDIYYPTFQWKLVH